MIQHSRIFNAFRLLQKKLVIWLQFLTKVKLQNLYSI